MGRFGLYNYPKRLEQAIERLKKDEKVQPGDRQLIIDFSGMRLAKGSGHGKV